MDYKILRVNMATKECKFEEIPPEYRGLGGRALSDIIVAKEVDPTCSPLGPLNKLVFVTGLLGGTNCANSNRISVGCKSPLTYGIKEANSGGQAGGHLAKMGIYAIIVEDAAPVGEWYQLEMSVDSAKLVPATVAGLDNYDAAAKLVEQYGTDKSYVTIGRAGEMCLAAASIAFTDRELRPCRHAGRGGPGAVMGSKRLKAIIIEPGKFPNVPLADKEAFASAAKRFAKAILEHPVTGQGLANYGTGVLVNILHEAGGLPTRNFSVGRFDGHDAVSGETLNQLTKERGGEGAVAHGCMTGCIIRCSGLFPDKKGHFMGKWPEYETLWAFGPAAEIDNIERIVQYDTICDDVGVDTIDVGAAIPLFMEAGIIPWGDADAVLDLMQQISKGTLAGRVLGCGAAITGRVLGLNRVGEVKGQAIPAYDPRAVKGVGVTYATTPMGADHTAGYAVATNILGVGGSLDPLKTEGQVELSRNLQIATAAVDSVGLCLFVAFPVLDIPDALVAIKDMINARYGWDLQMDDVTKLGQKVLEVERKFNQDAGIGQGMDRLPDFFIREKLPPHNVIFDIQPAELDSVFNWIQEPVKN